MDNLWITPLAWDNLASIITLVISNYVYMIAYLNGVIKSIDNNKFVEKESGKDVEYNTIFLQIKDQDGNLKTEQLNTKRDLSNFIDKEVTVTLNIYPDFDNKKLKRVSVQDVVETNEL